MKKKRNSHFQVKPNIRFNYEKNEFKVRFIYNKIELFDKNDSILGVFIVPLEGTISVPKDSFLLKFLNKRNLMYIINESQRLINRNDKNEKTLIIKN